MTRNMDCPCHGRPYLCWFAALLLLVIFSQYFLVVAAWRLSFPLLSPLSASCHPPFPPFPPTDRLVGGRVPADLVFLLPALRQHWGEI